MSPDSLPQSEIKKSTFSSSGGSHLLAINNFMWSFAYRELNVAITTHLHLDLNSALVGARSSVVG
jgi:hypothetical protein